VKKPTRHSEYQVSERVVLRPGDVFRASGGPYWRSGNEKIRLTAPGPFKFLAYVRSGAVGWIEAFDKNGCFAAIHVEGRRKRIDCSLVPRPYKVLGKKRAQSQRLDNRKRR
jgi:hypothetical protein